MFHAVCQRHAGRRTIRQHWRGDPVGRHTLLGQCRLRCGQELVPSLWCAPGPGLTKCIPRAAPSPPSGGDVPDPRPRSRLVSATHANTVCLLASSPHLHTLSRAGTMIYALPAPRSHWIPSALPCIVYRLPCPANTPGCNPDEQPELPSQPCPHRELPSLFGKTVSLLPLGGAEEAFPFSCAAGLVVSEMTILGEQVSPSCGGVCPAGSMCPGGGSPPLPCTAGGFCPTGSAAATPCVATTFSPLTNLTSARECSSCPAGSACATGAAAPSICSPGTFSSDGASVCAKCAGGTFQDAEGATTCSDCMAGAYCPPGAVR